MAFVLVADGDTKCAERVSGALIAAGHACSWVSNAQQVMALMRWRQPDLMVLDEDMPDGAGGSLLHALRSSEQCRSIPIILMKAPGEMRRAARQEALGSGGRAAKAVRSPPCRMVRQPCARSAAGTTEAGTDQGMARAQTCRSTGSLNRLMRADGKPA